MSALHELATLKLEVNILIFRPLAGREIEKGRCNVETPTWRLVEGPQNGIVQSRLVLHLRPFTTKENILQELTVTSDHDQASRYVRYPAATQKDAQVEDIKVAGMP